MAQQPSSLETTLAGAAPEGGRAGPESNASVTSRLARQLVAREAASFAGPDAEVSAARIACETVCRDLARWVGVTGCNALFNRAALQERATRPLLTEIRVDAGSEPPLNGVAEMVETHGASAVAAGLESLLATVLALLGRLIGEDITAQILAHPTRTDGSK